MRGKPGSYRAALQHRDYRRVLAGLTVSQIGDWLYNVALVVFVYDATHSATWVGIVTGLRITPYVVFGPLGGEIADRFERRMVMIVCDLIRIGLMIGLGVVAQTNGPVLVAGVLAFLTTTAGTPYAPSVAAMTPELVGEDDLAAANGIESAVQNISIIIGPAIGAGLLALGSPAMAFFVNAATFGLSAIAVLLMRSRSRATAAEAAAASGMWKRVREGIGAIAGSRPARILVVFIVATSFIYGTDTVLFVLISKEKLGTGADGYGTLLAALGAGGLIASFITNRLAQKPGIGTIMVGGFVLYTAPTLLMLVIHSPTAAFFVQTARGAGTIIVDVLVITALQRWAPKDVVGRVFGVVFSLAVAGIFVGSFLTPAIVGVGDLTTGLIVFGAAPGLIALWFLPRLRAMDREAAAHLEELRPAIELLGRLSIFRQAPRGVLEAMAASAERVTVPAGDTVIRQGDPAQDFYAIESGMAQVTVRDERGAPEVVAVLREGDYFGEIGLLREIPRTADVNVTSNAVLLRLTGAEFLHAVNDSPGAQPVALEGVSRRLAVSAEAEKRRELACEFST
ncbi:MAG: MFS transporter [Actinomycetota bacterium]